MRGGPGGRFGRGHGHRHGHGRGGRIGRFLEHGDLRFVVLALIETQPRHGYELIRELEDRTGGAYRPSPGVIYPTLSMLEDEGFVRPAAAEGGRKLYEITEEGRGAMETQRDLVEAVFAKMAGAQDRAQASRSGPRIRRAMENLGTAVRLRLSSGDVTEAQVDAITKIVDEAASAVERV
jgi:DNA-binding PadR family transcriptional regulator